MASLIFVDDTVFTLADLHCLRGIENVLDDVRDDSIVQCARGEKHLGEDVYDGETVCCRCSHVHDVEAPCPTAGVSCGRIDCCQP